MSPSSPGPTIPFLSDGCGRFLGVQASHHVNREPLVALKDTAFGTLSLLDRLAFGSGRGVAFAPAVALHFARHGRGDPT